MTKDIPLKSGTLSAWWLDRLSELVEINFPDVIGCGELTDHWKVDGWNDGTTTLFGVYKVGEFYWMCKFPDYAEGESVLVNPKFEHTGWSKK